MSSETASTDEPNHFLNGEGCQGRAGQSRKDIGPKASMSGQRVGGVSGGGGLGRGDGISWETCRRADSPVEAATAGTTPSLAAKTVRAVAGVGDLHSSVEARDSITRAERREGTCANAHQRSEGPDKQDDGRGDNLWIRTSLKVRKLQRALYRKAKAEPRWRFYSLYGELCRGDLLADALDAVMENGGAPGVDGFRVEQLKEDATFRAEWLAALAVELRSKTYWPSPVRRVYIWKDLARTKRRPLGIPTVKDRVVQTAVAILLQPIWEADFHDYSYAYRPGRNTHQAMDTIKEALLSGRTEVVDADLSSYFDTIPHRERMRRVARRLSDGAILKLIKAWLRAPIVEEDRASGQRKVTPNTRGTPQGGVISPLLANLYLDPLDHAVNDRCELQPVRVRYADDLVILARPGQGAGLRERLQRWTQQRGLALNEEKTRLVDFRREAFTFLGFNVSRRLSRKGRWYPHVEPSAKSCGKLRSKVRELLNVRTRNQPTGEVVTQLNRVTQGWARAFHYANSTAKFDGLQHYVRQTLRRWLWRKHSGTRALFTHYTDDRLHGPYKLWRWPLHAAWTKA
jgi:RNA-directed DNA polymerase